MGSKKSANTFKRRLLLAAVVSCFGQGAQAAPTGAAVASGSASIATSGSTMTITNTPNAIINWASFGIAAGETVRFVQQSASSAVLNRVTGNDPSYIFGALQSNGRVFLINPNGIMFGAGARIDVAGLVASTLNITDADFLAGKFNFNADRATPGNVVNAGEITTPSGGFVYLLAPNVENSGVITTPSGEAILAAGNSVEIVNSTDPSQRVLVSATSQDVNLSQLMTQNNGNIFSVLNSGKVSANTAVQDASGRIFFKSAGNITTTASSVVEAKGDLNANGGKFIGFADQHGLYAGSFDVSGKNGGFIETSGHTLDINGASVYGGALDPNGQGGAWLLDPFDYTIDSSAAAVIDSALAGGFTVTVDTASGSAYYGGLTGSTGVGNIYVNAAITSNDTGTGGSNGLTLIANGSIYINAPITSTNTSKPFNVSMTAYDTIYGNNKVIGTGTAGGSVNLYATTGSIYATVNSPLFSATAYGSNQTIDLTSLYGGTISSVGLNNPNYWTYLHVQNQSSFSTNVISSANGIGGLSIDVNGGNLLVNGLPATTIESLYLQALNVTVQNAVSVADGGGWVGAGIDIWGKQSVVVNANVTASSSASPTGSYSSGAWVSIGGGTSTIINGNISATSSAAGTEASIDIWSDGSLVKNSGATITATAPLSSGIWLEGYNSALIYGGAISASGSGDDGIEVISQNITLSGASLNADWIGLNYDPNFIQTNAAEFFDWNSTATVTVDNSSYLYASLGLGFAGNDVFIQNGSTLSAPDMHGIAMNKLDITGGAGLFAYNDMLLEMGAGLNVNTGGYIEVGSPYTLYFNFPLLASGGWFVDGVEGAFSGPSGSFIRVAGAAPILNSNFFVTYGGTQVYDAILKPGDIIDPNGLIDQGMEDALAGDPATGDEFFGSDEEDDSESGGSENGNNGPRQCG